MTDGAPDTTIPTTTGPTTTGPTTTSPTSTGTTRRRVAVLISGRGSNMTALIEAASCPDYPAEIALVVSNRPGAAGLETARAVGLETAVIDHKTYSDRRDFEAHLDALLHDRRIDLVCLAGFMRLLTPEFTSGWAGRLLNIHPSLLPAFKGLDVHRRVADAGVRVTGCTVHLVTAEMDAGPILAQAAVPVYPQDSPDVIAARVLGAEHECYPHALALYASGRLIVGDDNMIVATGGQAETPTARILSPARLGCADDTAKAP